MISKKKYPTPNKHPRSQKKKKKTLHQTNIRDLKKKKPLHLTNIRNLKKKYSTPVKHPRSQKSPTPNKHPRSKIISREKFTRKNGKKIRESLYFSKGVPETPFPMHTITFTFTRADSSRSKGRVKIITGQETYWILQAKPSPRRSS